MQQPQPSTQQLVRTVLAPQYMTTPKANGAAGAAEPAEDDVKFFFDFEECVARSPAAAVRAARAYARGAEGNAPRERQPTDGPDARARASRVVAVISPPPPRRADRCSGPPTTPAARRRRGSTR